MSNETSLADKVVLVTGGSSGIGEGCVRYFFKHGAKVAFCSNVQEAGDCLAAELNAQASEERAFFVLCDVNKSDQIKEFVKNVIKRWERLDCLINNVGWHPGHRPIDDFTEEEFMSLFRLNVLSCFLFCQQSLSHLRKYKGSIINISSMVAMLGQEGAVTYAATKAAISGITKTLAIDEAKHKVRVNTVLPATIRTPLAESHIKLFAEQTMTTPEQIALKLGATTLLNRLGTTEEVAAACFFLASDAAKFITGTELPVSGGCELGWGPKSNPVFGI